MERLTSHESENYNQPGCNTCSDYRWRSCKESGEITDCIKRLTWVRLCSIEDILGDDYDLDRLRELVEADRERRCVVLPCKVGDNVYVIDSGDYQSGYKPYVREKEVTEISWKKVRNGKGIGFGLILKGGDCNTSARYKISSIGKSVFLTREAAEAALKGENNGR